MLTPAERENAIGAIRLALAEDVGSGDLTSNLIIGEDIRFRGLFRARHAMVVAGLPVAEEVFRQLMVSDTVFLARSSDGESVNEGAVIAEVSGPARALLTAERTALNFLQLLSGMATLTQAYAKRIQGTGCTLLDTRKTIPGLRALSKYATRCGGAANHRMGLYDAILIKDNHLGACGSITEAVRRARAGSDAAIEVECDSLEQVAETLSAGADRILLDNMTPAQLREGVAMARGRAQTEASGGVTLATIREIAETGVDFVSVGRITQSAPAADIGLDWEAAAV